MATESGGSRRGSYAGGRARAGALLMLLALASAALSGCADISYVARAAYETGRLLWNRKPISAELARGDLPADVREKLETVLAVRKFAAGSLGLNVGGAYTTTTEIDQGAIVWVVMAAPKDELTPYTWWFPIVGDVPYRGYFHKDDALAQAKEMEDQGYDTLVRPSVAFSSLGYFDDPLLSNLLRLDRVELAGVIIHELFHRTYFLPGEIKFDESAATYVGGRGAVDFFTATEGPNSADAKAARSILESNLKFAAFLTAEQTQLVRLYRSGLSRDEIIKRREPIFARIDADYDKLKPSLYGLERFDLDQVKLNNAVLLNYLIYFHGFDDFVRLDRKNRCELKATINGIIELAESDRKDPFSAIRKAVTLPPGPAGAGPPTPPCGLAVQGTQSAAPARAGAPAAALGLRAP